MRERLLLFAIGAGALLGCATIPESAGGKDALPNAAAGPFRAILSAELGNTRAAPNVLTETRDFSRDASVLDLDGDPTTLEVAGYLAANPHPATGEGDPSDPPSVIERYGAIDGRSFDRAAEVVLEASAGWEAGTVGAPAAIRVGGDVWLYYGAGGGVGLARGDGHTFAKEPGPVLAPSASGWDAGLTPLSPGVVQLESGSFRMFYEVRLPAGAAIGEAASDDGVRWARVGDGPALAPSGEEYDASWVGSPAPALGVSATGRSEVRVYYAARDAAGVATIGLAARYGDDGPLGRGVSSVFGSTNDYAPTEPCVVAFDGFQLLFVTEHTSANNDAPAVAAGVAPATADLPPPNPL